jgi:hypothetical protein
VIYLVENSLYNNDVLERPRSTSRIQEIDLDCESCHENYQENNEKETLDFLCKVLT